MHENCLMLSDHRVKVEELMAKSFMLIPPSLISGKWPSVPKKLFSRSLFELPSYPLERSGLTETPWGIYMNTVHSYSICSWHFMRRYGCVAWPLCSQRHEQDLGWVWVPFSQAWHLIYFPSWVPIGSIPYFRFTTFEHIITFLLFCVALSKIAIFREKATSVLAGFHMDPLSS